MNALLPQRQKISHSQSGHLSRAQQGEMNSETQGNVWVHYLEAAFRHRRWMMIVFALTMALGWVALIVHPRGYESEARLILRVGRESVSLDPTATTSQTLTLQKTQEEEIRSAAEVLQSRGLIELVVKELGAANILDGSLPSEDSGEQSSMQEMADWARGRFADVVDFGLTTSGIRDPLSDHELAIRELQGVIYVTVPRKSNVIVIYAESKTPEMAQTIVDTMVKTFTKEHIKMSRTNGSLNFFQEQVAERKKAVAESVEERKNFMQSNNIVSIEASRATLQQQVAAIERDLILARGQLEQTEAEIADLLDRADSAPAEIIATKENRVDSTWSGMRQKIYDLEVTEKSLDAKYTEAHPVLIATREQLKGARAILAKVSSERVNESMTPNPVRRRIQEDLQKLETSVVGLKSLISEKQAQHQEVLASVDEMHKLEQKLSVINREVGQRETALNVLQDKLEESRVLNELQTQAISNVGIAQPATFVERPISPKKKILAAGTGLMAICLSIGVMFCREFFHDVLMSGGRVESQLQTKLLCSLPKVRGAANAVVDKLSNECDPVISDLLFNKSSLGIRPGGTITVGVVGSENGCGNTTFATALAAAASKTRGLRTLLIDAGTGPRSISNNYGGQNTCTLEQCIADGGEASDCVKPISPLGIDLVTAAQSASDSNFDRGNRHATSLLEELSEGRDLVVIDLPPVSQTDRLLALTKHVDCVIVVAQSDRTTASTSRNVLNALSGNGLQVAGVVMNKGSDPLPRSIRQRIPS